jgi:hypothetical protein
MYSVMFVHSLVTIFNTVQWQQIPITSTYGFIDYRAQGLTLSYVFIDITTPPSGGLSLFNLYIILFRGSGQSTIWLLRDFDPKQFMQTHSIALLEENRRLEDLDKKTKEWWQKMGRDTQSAVEQ